MVLVRADDCWEMTHGEVTLAQASPAPSAWPDLDGKTLPLAEVSAGGRWYAVNPAKPEFYVQHPMTVRDATHVPEDLSVRAC
jgi:hypothetical protein